MIDRPWMTALEMQFAAVKVLRGALKAEAPSGTVFLKDMEPRLRSRLAGYDQDSRSLLKAETYSWSSDTTSAILLASRTIPESSQCVSSMMPGAVGWWWFNKPISLDSLDRNEATHLRTGALGWPKDLDWAICALLFHVVDDRVWFRLFCPLGLHSPDPFEWQIASWVSWSVLFAATIADFNVTAKVNSPQIQGILTAIMRIFVAGSVWLQQRILISSSAHVERHRQKQLAREYNAPLPSEVKVIQLRRVEPQQHSTGTANEPIDWSCRWIVGGHWRNQPYKERRKLIYIMPYVKGPADKPLKVPTHTVYQVNR